MLLDFWVTAALLLAVVYLLYLYLTWNYGYWQKMGVPSLRPTAPFGNFGDITLAKKSLGDGIRDIYKKAGDVPFVGYYNLRTPMLLVKDPKLCRTVLVQDFSSFHENMVKVNEELDPIFSRNPFVLAGERWRKTRSQLTPSFTASRLKPMYILIREVCEDLSRFIKKEIQLAGQDGLEAKEICFRYTTDAVTNCALGVKGDALQNPNSSMYRLAKLILEPSFRRNMEILLRIFLPKVADILRVRIMPLEAEAFLRKVVMATVSKRETQNIQRDDYLQLLINLKRDGQLDSTGQVLADKSAFTDIDIVAQVTTFITDGFDTSSTAMAFMLYNLAVNPDVQERLRQELNELLEKHDGLLTYELIQEATYLDMVFSESLRLHPPAMSMDKICTAPYKLQTPSGKTFTLQPGTPVTVSIAGLHTDENHFPQPNVFDPERFSADNKRHPGMQAYMPFGAGPRSCIGMRFAMAQVKMGVAAVVKDFELFRTPRTPVPVEIDPKGFLLTAKGGLWIGFRPLAS